MSRTLDEVFQEAAQLPERDRAALAGMLIESLDDGSEPDDSEMDVESAWSAEIERRVADIDAGRAQTSSWEQVRKDLFGRGDAG